MIVAIIQARMSSTRLPGKVLRTLAEKPLLWHIIQRVKSCPKIDRVVVATSFDHSDDPLARQVEAWGIPLFRGPLEDVLERYYRAAQKYGATHVIRVTGDNPLTDPVSLEKAIDLHLAKRGDHTCVTGLPLGTAAEIVSMKALEEAFYKGHDQPHREHVTVYIKEHPERFHLLTPAADAELTWPELRLTVDTPEDFRLMEEIYRRLYRNGEIVSLTEVINLLKRHPEIVEMNSHVPQKAVRDKNILIRVDGYVQKGLGHVMRCLALARHITARVPVKIAFLMRDYPEGIRKVEEAGYKVYLLPREATLAEEEAVLGEATGEFKPDIILIDLLDTAAEHGLIYKNTGAKIAVLDNLGPGGGEADLLINALLAQDFAHLILNPSVSEMLEKGAGNASSDGGGSSETSCGDTSTVAAPGANSVEVTQSASPGIKRVFVSLGGADPANLTGLVLRGLARVEGIDEVAVDVVLGPAYPWDESLRGIVHDFPGKAHIYIDVEDMAALMSRCDLAFSASGLTMFELAALGIPSVILCHNEGQLPNAAYMAEKGVVVDLGLGNRISPDQIATAYLDLAQNYPRRQEMAARARNVVDGNGLSRVVDRLVELLYN